MTDMQNADSSTETGLIGAAQRFVVEAIDACDNLPWLSQSSPVRAERVVSAEPVREALLAAQVAASAAQLADFVAAEQYLQEAETAAINGGLWMIDIGGTSAPMPTPLRRAVDSARYAVMKLLRKLGKCAAGNCANASTCKSVSDYDGAMIRYCDDHCGHTQEDGWCVPVSSEKAREEEAFQEVLKSSEMANVNDKRVLLVASSDDEVKQSREEFRAKLTALLSPDASFRIVDPYDPWPWGEPDPRTPHGRAQRFLDALDRGPRDDADADRLLFEMAPTVVRDLMGTEVKRDGSATTLESHDGTDLRDHPALVSRRPVVGSGNKTYTLTEVAQMPEVRARLSVLAARVQEKRAEFDCPACGSTPYGTCQLYCPVGGRRTNKGVDSKNSGVGGDDLDTRLILGARNGESTKQAATRVASACENALDALLKTEHVKAVPSSGCNCLICKAVEILQF